MGVVSTNERDCRDCYRCVRTCAVKAVQVKGGRARVMDERCVMDGRCIKACPQKAKVAERGLERVREFLRAGDFVVASLAPSFPVSFPGRPTGLATGLKKLGFAYVEETAVAARLVALEHRRFSAEAGRPLITSSCPSLLSLVSKYYPAALAHIAPIVSPMAAHGRLLRQVHADREIRVVFVGPSAAKKGEVADPLLARRGGCGAVVRRTRGVAGRREYQFGKEQRTGNSQHPRAGPPLPGRGRPLPLGRSAD